MCIPCKVSPDTLFQDGPESVFLQENQMKYSPSERSNDAAMNTNQISNSQVHYDRHDLGKQFVQHNYHDHAQDNGATYLEIPMVSKGGVTVPFPTKLHNMLDHIAEHEPELSSIVSWQPHGRCFLVKKIKNFTSEVLPRFFDQRKYASFQRQLNLYGFNRLTSGPDRGSYYHELFLRSKIVLCRGIHRMKIKGTGSRMAGNPQQEPNFYLMEEMPSVASSSESNQTRQVRRKTVSPPTPMKEELEQDNTEMPPLVLPNQVQSSTIKIEDPCYTNNQPLEHSFPQPIESSVPEKINPTSTHHIDSADPSNTLTDDLRFVFGGMPFHSLFGNDNTPPNVNHTGRRNSLIGLALSNNSSATGGSGSAIEDVDTGIDMDIEKGMEYIYDLSEASEDTFDKEDIYDILDTIISHDT
jgi:hypothetical protein